MRVHVGGGREERPDRTWVAENHLCVASCMRSKGWPGHCCQMGRAGVAVGQGMDEAWLTQALEGFDSAQILGAPVTHACMQARAGVPLWSRGSWGEGPAQRGAVHRPVPPSPKRRAVESGGGHACRVSRALGKEWMGRVCLYVDRAKVSVPRFERWSKAKRPRECK